MSNVEVADDATLKGRTLVFRDRTHAGEALAEALIRLGWHQQKVVLAIPAGGVEVAVAATEKLGLPLELAVTRKLHIPWNREAGFGAVSWEGDVTLNEPLTRAIGLTHAEIQMVIAEERATIEKRLRLYRGDAPPPTLIGKRVVVIDDGLASGYSMLVTLKALRRKGVSETTVAVPTGHTRRRAPPTPRRQDPLPQPTTRRQLRRRRRLPALARPHGRRCPPPPQNL